MIHPGGRYPRSIAMAIFTHIGGLNVSTAFAGCACPVMAGGAVRCDSGMIEIGRHPGVGRMAAFAIISARDMSGVFTGRDGAVMTAGADSNHLSMIDLECRHPSGVAVTTLTAIGRLDMGCALARCG